MIIIVGYLLMMGAIWVLRHPNVTGLMQRSATIFDFLSRLETAVKIMGGFFLITWLLHFFDRYFLGQGLLKRGKIFSRGFFPIFTMFTFPFFHGNYSHLQSTTPLTILFAGLAVMFIPSLTLAIQVGIIMFLVQGVGVWIFGKKGTPHVGSSGLMLGLFSFDVLFGILELGWQTAVVFLLLLFFGKRMYRTLIDRSPKTSAITHMWGFFSGIVIAYFVSPFGPLSI
ncbi:MAG: rhomboid family intramembrane serine protease [Chloroflexi bacterium]|nr:rhomboid family intramembrane serine protease [Chloroflexota bacterium]